MVIGGVAAGGVVAGGMALGIAAATSATAASALKKAAERKRVGDNVNRLVSYARLVQHAAKRQAEVRRRWRQACELVRRRLVARRRLRVALEWARRVVLRARVRQMLARRAVRTSTAVDTVHSMCSTLRVEDGMTAATTAKSTSTRRQPVLRHAAHAGVRVVELVRACERQRTATRVGLTATAPIIATLVGVS